LREPFSFCSVLKQSKFGVCLLRRKKGVIIKLFASRSSPNQDTIAIERNARIQIRYSNLSAISLRL